MESVLALLKAKEKGHEIKYLAAVHAKDGKNYLYQTPNIGLTLMQSQVINIQLVSKEAKSDEDLKVLLNGLNCEGVVCGLVENKKERRIIKKVCKELNLKLLTPLWGLKKGEMLEEVVKNRLEAIITAINDSDESLLGKIMDEKVIAELKSKNCDILSENGKFEAIVLDCHAFQRSIKITKDNKEWNNETKSGKLIIEDAVLVNKQEEQKIYNN
jgi:asparagine synthase (glutamine-hydrolysing)